MSRSCSIDNTYHNPISLKFKMLLIVKLIVLIHSYDLIDLGWANFSIKLIGILTRLLVMPCRSWKQQRLQQAWQEHLGETLLWLLITLPISLVLSLGLLWFCSAVASFPVPTLRKILTLWHMIRTKELEAFLNPLCKFEIDHTGGFCFSIN